MRLDAGPQISANTWANYFVHANLSLSILGEEQFKLLAMLRGKHNRFLSFIQVLTKKSCVDNGLITMFTSRHLASYHTTVPQITSTFSIGYTISLQSRHPFRRNRSKTVCSLAGNAQVGILSGCIFRLAHIYIHHQTTHLRRVCTRYIIYRGKKRLESHF